MKLFLISFILGAISRLLGDPVYESLARRALNSIWELRDNSTGLFGNVMNIQTGRWISNVSNFFSRKKLS